MPMSTAALVVLLNILGINQCVTVQTAGRQGLQEKESEIMWNHTIDTADYNEESASWNGTFNYADYYYSEPIWLQVLFAVCFGSVTILGVGGNAIVCYIVLSDPQMRTGTNYFIVNMAIGDILMAIFCVNFTFYSTLYWTWPFGIATCKIVSFVQSVSVSVSIYTLVAMTMERYVAIVHPLKMKTRSGSSQRRFMIAFIWLGACAWALPMAIYSSVQSGNGVSSCLESSNWSSDVYSVLGMVLQYFLPLAALAIGYWRIGKILWGRNKNLGEMEDAGAKQRTDSKKRLVKMFAVIVLLFAINYFPVHVFNILQDVFPQLNNFYYIKLFYLVVMLFAMSNCCHSPIIYCWMNVKYRQGFKGVFECIFLAGMCRGKGCGPKIYHQKPQVIATRSIGGDSSHSTIIRRTPIIKVEDMCHSVV